MTADTIFRIASMTKPIASAALMMLWEEGHFQLRDPISKWLPEFAEMRVAVAPDGRRVSGAALQDRRGGAPHHRAARADPHRRAFPTTTAARRRDLYLGVAQANRQPGWTVADTLE